MPKAKPVFKLHFSFLLRIAPTTAITAGNSTPATGQRIQVRFQLAMEKLQARYPAVTSSQYTPAAVEVRRFLFFSSRD